MTATVQAAKAALDKIIDKARVDLYKPIQVAEVLYHSRTEKNIDLNKVDSYKNRSCHWRDEVTKLIAGKVSTSSAQFQHNLWNENAIPPSILQTLDQENKASGGAVERYIYLRYSERQSVVTAIIASIETATPKTFQLRSLLELFETTSGIRRSVDKAYEIVTHSLLETLVVALGAKVKVSVPEESRALITEFQELTEVLLGITPENLSWENSAHIYRVGVTNAADRGLDMWANFGPAVQVKHLSLSESLANEIVDQVESDHIIIVCKSADARIVELILKQISWGRRVRGIITEVKLIDWYERCLRGRFNARLGAPLLKLLSDGFKSEFPQVANPTLTKFLEDRGYTDLKPPKMWMTASDSVMT